jgi:hypothetical protein
MTDDELLNQRLPSRVPHSRTVPCSASGRNPAFFGNLHLTNPPCHLRNSGNGKWVQTTHFAPALLLLPLPSGASEIRAIHLSDRGRREAVLEPGEPDKCQSQIDDSGTRFGANVTAVDAGSARCVSHMDLDVCCPEKVRVNRQIEPVTANVGFG